MPTCRRIHARTPAARGLFDAEEYDRQRAYFTTRAATTPLVALPALAESLGAGALWLKDETARFGLPAFKSLGVEFAVHRLAERGELAGVTTLVCASAGNHGRAVARAARSAGLAATIFLDAGVAAARVAAIAGEGADIVRVDRQLRRRRARRRRPCRRHRRPGGLRHGVGRLHPHSARHHARLHAADGRGRGGMGRRRPARRAPRPGRRRWTAGRRRQLVGVDLRSRRGRASWPWSRRWRRASRPRRGPGARRRSTAR